MRDVVYTSTPLFGVRALCRFLTAALVPAGGWLRRRAFAYTVVPVHINCTFLWRTLRRMQ